MKVKEHFEKYGKIIIQDKDKAVYSNGTNFIGGVYKKKMGMI